VTLNPWKTNYHNRKLLKHGLPAHARVVEFEPTKMYAGPINDLQVCKVTIEFEAQGGRVVRADGRIPIYIRDVRDWMVGEHSFHIRYDPHDPTKWTYSEKETDEAWRQAASGRNDPAPAFDPGQISLADLGQVFSGVQVVNASGADPASVIEKLARVRDQGLISQAQFEAAQRQVEGTPASPVSPDAGVAERLKQLDALHDQHLVSDEEYSAERKRILDAI
jgi:hypothetical protein